MKKIVSIIFTAIFVTGCSGSEIKHEYPKSAEDIRYDRAGSMFGSKDGFKILGNNEKKSTTQSLNVNIYLWKAALDVVSFMPLASVDSASGIIITDWFEDPNAPKERFKLNIIITGAELKINSIKVTLFKQIMDSKFNWRDAKVNNNVAQEFEDKIITRARQIKISKE
ncbi:MAG: DUF3576 domain-containing protein [Alphaproteobacteria bacterium]